MNSMFINTMTLEDAEEHYLPLKLPITDEDFERRKQRIRLVKEYLDSAMKALADRILMQSSQDALQDLAESVSVAFQISEVEEHLLLLAGILSNVTEQDRETIFLFDTEFAGQSSLETYQSLIENLEEHFARKAASMRETARILRFRFLPIIRGKLAALECLAVAGNFKAISELIRVCPKYLSCPIIQQKIHENTLTIRYGSQEESRRAKSNSQNLCEAFDLPGNRRSKREGVSYWGVRLLYEQVVQLLQAFQSGNLSEAQFKLALQRYSLPDIDLEIRNSSKSLQSLAKEFLISGSALHSERYGDGYLPVYLSVESEKQLENIISVYTRNAYNDNKPYLELPHIRIYDVPGFPELDRIRLNARLYEVWDWMERGKIEAEQEPEEEPPVTQE